MNKIIVVVQILRCDIHLIFTLGDVLLYLIS